MQLTPLFTKVRFGMWTDVLAEPAPPDDLQYMNAMWHGARGLAHAGENRPEGARQELAALAALKDDPSLKTMYVSSVNAASSIVAIAHEILSGQLAAKEGRGNEAVRHFAAAVKLEDGLTYMEPPDWPIPARELQGLALLQLGRAKEAEAAFREDLRKFPDNGWALSGLLASLTRQGRSAEAADVKARLEEQWRRADPEARAAAPK
jgi:Flp pilus assembly protein TadD